jgi:hypothetical protein
MLCVAKAMSGGLAPIGAVIATAPVAKSMEEKDGTFYSTYGWHPRSVAAAIATLRGLKADLLLSFLSFSYSKNALHATLMISFLPYFILILTHILYSLSTSTSLLTFNTSSFTTDHHIIL